MVAWWGLRMRGMPCMLAAAFSLSFPTWMESCREQLQLPIDRWLVPYVKAKWLEATRLQTR